MKTTRASPGDRKKATATASHNWRAPAANANIVMIANVMTAKSLILALAYRGRLCGNLEIGMREPQNIHQREYRGDRQHNEDEPSPSCSHLLVAPLRIHLQHLA